MVCRLADYFQAPDYIALLILVCGEQFPCHASHRPSYALYRKDYVVQALCIFHGLNIRHSGTMSFLAVYAK